MRAGCGGRRRDPAEIRIFALMTVIVAPTDAEAAAKLADYRRYTSLEGALTLLSGWTGVDFAALDPDQIVEHVDREAGRSALESITRADPNRRWTVREVAEHVGIGGIGPVLVGSPRPSPTHSRRGSTRPASTASTSPSSCARKTFEDVADLLVPELQRRGRYKQAYAPGTLREKLFGAGRALPAPDHPAARHRWRLAPTDAAPTKTAPAETALPA